MAPKKPPDKEPVKKTPAKEAGKPKPKAQGPTFQERLKKFIESQQSLYVGGLLLLSSIIASAVLMHLYNEENQRRIIFRKGTRKILEHLEEQFPELLEADDFAKFKKAENVSESIIEEKRKIAEVSHAISDVEHRLKEDWVVWHGSLYLFDLIATPRSWTKCKVFCDSLSYNTKLLCVESDAEQEFVYSICKNRPTDYYVGISLVGKEWVCHDRSVKVDAEYWGRGFPRNKGMAQKDTTNCVIIQRKCTWRCWADVHCHDLKRCICKRKPVEKWMR